MRNKKIFLLSLILPIVFLAILFVPKVFAAYDCNINYPGAAITSADLNACCYPASKEPYGGISCRPEGTFLQKIGGVVTCTEESSLVTKAASQQSKNRKYFNCFTGATPAVCRDGYCPQVGTGTCIQATGTSCPASKNRVNQCPGACGTCNQDSVYCPVPTEGPKDPGFDVGPNYAAAESCQLKKYGPTTTDPSDPNSCANQGKSVANYCTGECTGCAAGYTLSGRNSGACIPFVQRFAEIFDDGLTWLGGQDWDPDGDGNADDFDKDGKVEEHAYDYSLTGPNGLKDVFLKSDMAETLNWNSTYLPEQIKWLLNNYNLCTVDSDCTGAQECAPGGYCYTPGGTGACTNSSDCDLGYTCDASGQCVNGDPSNGESVFAGLTTASNYNGDQGGYRNVTERCNVDYPGSHVCTAQEMITSYNVNVVPALPNKVAWINVAGPGNVNPAVNDCNGWRDKYDSGDYYGTAWVFNVSAAGVAPCNATFSYACCR